KHLSTRHACVIALATPFLLVPFDRAGHLRANPNAYVPAPPLPKAAPAAPATTDANAGKPPPHNDKVEDLPDGPGREVTFYTCTACHGVALIKAQGLTRDLWDSTFDLMLEKHRMPPVKAAERAEILDYLSQQFPPRRRGRGT